MRRLLLIVLTCLAVAAPAAPAHTADADLAKVGKGDLLTLDEAATVYDGLLKKSFRDTYRFGLGVPEFSASPLVCDETRYEKGVSNVVGSYYPVQGPYFSLDETIVELRSGAAARALVQHYRDYARVCRGTHPTTDGEGGAAQQRVRAWQPKEVGAERAGVLEAFVQGGRTGWFRTLVTRVGRTVVVLQSEVGRGLPSARELTAATRLAVEKLA